jgi:hypothetical protein
MIYLGSEVLDKKMGSGLLNGDHDLHASFIPLSICQFRHQEAGRRHPHPSNAQQINTTLPSLANLR